MTQTERKVVTVLFADLVGFTSRSESLDPEDVQAILGPYHERVRAELERHGGTVEKFIGDAVMALFGAPTAHEDDPERAVRAAIAIRDWAREEGELEVRIGITTGEALVSLGARPEAGEGMASGDVVNTGSRLESAAPANGILVDETTYRATEHVFGYRGAEAVEAKGKSEPIAVWEPQAAKAIAGVELRPETPLVGRERERDLLVDALARVKRESAPQLLTLVGVPGIGKSRLVAELYADVDRDPDLVFWRHGRSLPYGEGVAFWAFAEMVKAQAGILNSDSSEVAAEKLHEAVAALLETREASWVEARLKPLIGEGERADDRDESFGAWRRFIEALAEQRATVLVFEDLHWADDDLLDFVDYLVDWAHGVPLLVVGTARPELLDRRPGWGGGKRNAITVSLSPLEDAETARLIGGLLERSVLPAEIQEELLRRAGGNPLYAEQFARMLAERGEVGDLPETIQGIIAARLDALGADEKGLLQDASVVGKVFWPGALHAVSGNGRDSEELLHGLERKEFVRRARRSGVEGETEYAFAHLLVRDVAYSQIPRAGRAERHRAAAEWIESLGRAEDRAELLAHHYVAALELSNAAGIDTKQIETPARSALVEAGDRAMSLNSFVAAERFYESALRLAPEGDRERPYILLRLGRAKDAGGPGGIDWDGFEALVAEFLAVGDVEAAAEAKLMLAVQTWNLGDSARAEEQLQETLELLADRPASRVKVEVLAELARYAMLSRDPDAPIRYAREGLALAEELGLDALRASFLNTIGTAKLGEGVSEVRQSLEIAFEINHPGEIHRAFNNLIEAQRRNGEWTEASRLLVELHEVDERFGIDGMLLWLRGEETTDHFVTGRWDETVTGADEVIGRADAGAPNYLLPICLANRAGVELGRGQDDLARADSSRAVEVGQSSDPQVSSTVFAVHAFVLLSLGDRKGAEEMAMKGTEVATYFQGAVDLAYVLRTLGRTDPSWVQNLRAPRWEAVAMAILAGDFHGAAELLEEIGAVAYEAYLRLRAGTDEDVRKALEFYRSVGATRYIREGEELLAATA